MLTYKGVGYTPAFVETMTAAVERIAQGAEIIPVDGPDDLCSALTEGCGHEGHCRDARTVWRDETARSSISAILPAIASGSLRIDSQVLESLRLAFIDRSIRAACEGCEWAPMCDEIAAGGFAESKLSPQG